MNAVLQKLVVVKENKNSQGQEQWTLKDKPIDQQVKSSQVCFIVNSATCTAYTYRELKLRYSQTPGAYR